MTAQIIIAGELTIPPEKRDAALESTKHLQQATRDDEPGCLAYVWSPDPCRDDVIVLYELWEDAESLAAHLVHANYYAMRKGLAEAGITGATSLKYRVDKSAQVYNADGVATADF